MKPDIRKRWVAALRSGEYKQGKGCLNDGKGGFCCLGVLADLYAKEFGCNWVEADLDRVESLDIMREIAPTDPKPRELYQASGPEVLHRNIVKWTGLPESNPSVIIGYEKISKQPCQDNLAALNDSGYTFERIADLIEKNEFAGSEPEGIKEDDEDCLP